jgi:hypothetical protein
VSDAELDKDRPVDLHPVRFTFKTGGRDGIYFPMKLTGLQTSAFDVNLSIPFLKDQAPRLPTLSKLFQKLHPGETYYLTNIQARGLKPADVRDWSDDLWLFPYYVDTAFVPFDARPGGPAAAAWAK